LLGEAPAQFVLFVRQLRVNVGAILLDSFASPVRVLYTWAPTKAVLLQRPGAARPSINASCSVSVRQSN
jgi:hypothetical protein